MSPTSRWRTTPPGSTSSPPPATTSPRPRPSSSQPTATSPPPSRPSSGAFDFIEKPIDLDLLRARCGKAIDAVFAKAENRDLRDRLNDTLGFDGLVGRSSAMRQIVTTLKQIAPSDASVLITGESGTGKELIAQAVHHHSNRANKAFVPLNCAGLSESILEDELFGHVRGAFTGAEKDREGRFEYANHGTLFLDEIGDMPTAMQAKLL
ncbi:MAG: sigma-54-dependent Fis family transcriptional regulator, partial [Planctomycetota bacterium]